MANTIILKRSATPGKVPTTSQIALGEIAINTYDGLIYIKKDDGTPSVVQIGGVTSVNSETGAVTLDTGDIAENGNLYFTNARARSALSAGSGITYNSSTGAISTTQTLTTAGSPTFAGLTLTGDIDITGDIIPSANNTYSLGTADYVWKDVYVGPGTLYVNGSPVITDDSGTMTFSADTDQNIRLTTVGAGVLQLGSSTTNVNVDGTLQIGSGKNITDSAGVEVNFGDNIDMNNNKIVGLGAPSANTDAATKKYVDDTVGAISTSSITQGNSNVTVTDTGTGTVTVSVDGSTALTVTSAGVVVAGNLTVSGTTTTVDSNTVTIADNILTLNSDATGAPTQNAGVEVERGDEANTQIRWNEGSDKWTFTNDGAVYYPMAVSTDDLAEGSTNLYHTTTRARGVLSASSSTGVSYNSSTGVISLGSIPNSSLSNNSITINGTSVALGGTRTMDTDVISEGSTNLYHTTARARGAVSAGTGISYNSTTGVITNTITQYTDALARGAVSASGDLSYDSGTGEFSFTQDKAFSALTDKPTTISGYGITDAYTKTEVNSAISTAVAGKDNTDEITEGTSNLYFTNARARGAVSASGSLSYDSVSGVFSYTAPTAVSAFTNDANYITSAANVASASKLQTARDIVLAGDVTGTVSFDGSGNVSMTTTIAANSVALGTDTTGNYMVGVTAGTGISVSHTAGEGSTATITNSLSTSGGSIGGAISVTGAITATGEVTAYYSDLRLKTNIVPIADALEKVEALNGVTFDPNETALALGIDNTHQMGVIAQEVEAVAPELVVDSAFAGFKTVKYDKLTALLIEAVKELSAKVKTLEAQLGNTKPTL